MNNPSGVAYPLWFRANVVAATGTISEVAQQFHCSEASVSRFRRLNAAGHLGGGRLPVALIEDRKLLLAPKTLCTCFSLLAFVPKQHLLS